MSSPVGAKEAGVSEKPPNQKLSLPNAKWVSEHWHSCPFLALEAIIHMEISSEDHAWGTDISCVLVLCWYSKDNQEIFKYTFTWVCMYAYWNVEPSSPHSYTFHHPWQSFFEEALWLRKGWAAESPWKHLCGGAVVSYLVSSLNAHSKFFLSLNTSTVGVEELWEPGTEWNRSNARPADLLI